MAVPNLFEYEYRPPWRTEHEHEYEYEHEHEHEHEKKHEPLGVPTSPSVTTVIRQLAHAS